MWLALYVTRFCLGSHCTLSISIYLFLRSFVALSSLSPLPLPLVSALRSLFSLSVSALSVTFASLALCFQRCLVSFPSQRCAPLLSVLKFSLLPKLVLPLNFPACTSIATVHSHGHSTASAVAFPSGNIAGYDLPTDRSYTMPRGTAC